MTGDPAAAPRRSAVFPLYAAGFITAFGAHSVAAGAGATSDSIGLTLVNLGVLLAVYDLAEVVLKPVFGSLSDRIGSRPVMVGGLAVFAVVSGLGIWADSSVMLVVARFGQGAAAAAFSPAASAAIARLSAGGDIGVRFGRYGSWKGLGYAFGPVLGAGLIWMGGFPLLFGTLAVLAAATALWVVLAVPRVAPVARPRYTVVDVIRQSTSRTFLVPTLALAGATGALGVAVGFLPALGSDLGMGVFASTAAVSVLAIVSSLIQPTVGRFRDQRRISASAGMAGGLVLAAAGAGSLALTQTPAMLYVAACALGAGIGIATPLAFAHLAETTPPARMGRTMGSAEIGREIGDAGGPLLVGGVATAVSLPFALGALASALAAVGVATRLLARGAR